MRLHASWRFISLSKQFLIVFFYVVWRRKIEFFLEPQIKPAIGALFDLLVNLLSCWRGVNDLPKISYHPVFLENGQGALYTIFKPSGVFPIRFCHNNASALQQRAYGDAVGKLAAVFRIVAEHVSKIDSYAFLVALVQARIAQDL